MFAVAVTPARQAVMDFTQPHMFSDVHAVASRSNVNVSPGWTLSPWSSGGRGRRDFHEPLMRERLHAARLLVVALPSHSRGRGGIGRADVFMSDYPFTRRMVKDHDWVRIIAPDKPFHVVNYAYAIAPGQPAWLGTLNQFVRNQQRSGRLRLLAQRYDLQPIVRDAQ